MCLRSCLSFLIPVFAVGGCATVPSLDQPFQQREKVQIQNVVNRVQCEIQEAVAKEVHDHKELVWLSAWTARIHFTLIVDDSASLTPGVLVTAPFQNAYGVVAGPTALGGTSIAAIPQFFSLGLGGGVTTEAIRTEDLEFDLSFSELAKNLKDRAFVRNLRGCTLENNLLLDSDLGLSDWIDAALKPAYGSDQILIIGKNVPLGAAAVPIPVTEVARDVQAQKHNLMTLASKVGKESRNGLKLVDQLLTLGVQSSDQTALVGDVELANTVDEARKLVSDKLEQSNEVTRATRKLYESVITPVDRAASHLTCSDKLGKALAKAEYEVSLTQSLAGTVSSDGDATKDVADLSNLFEAYKKAEGTPGFDNAKAALLAMIVKVKADGARIGLLVDKQSQEQLLAADAAQGVLEAFTACQVQSDTPKTDALYDPMTLISHQVSFVIIGNGSASPSWKLARVTAPATGTLAAGSRKNTNTLIIAMGRSGEAVKQQVQTQQLRSALMQ